MGRRGASWVGLLLVLLATIAGAPSAAAAGPTESALALNDKGAALFKRKQYVEAAAAFERAYAIDPRDFRVLRYAGRCWQEIGDWERALALLERYVKLETDAEARATIQPSLDKLRAATPAQKAEALAAATRAYPHARLEEAAARALEALGGRANLLRAVEQLEVARLAAPDEAEKRRLAAEIDRLRTAAARAPAAAAATDAQATPGSASATPPAVTPGQSPAGVRAPAPSSGLTTTQWVAIGGGVLAASAGATLWITAARATEEANTDFIAGKTTYAAYTDLRDAASLRYWGGIGLCALGVGGAITGVWLGRPSAARPAPAARLLPVGRGVALHVTF